jgi:hypothetical protein
MSQDGSTIEIEIEVVSPFAAGPVADEFARKHRASLERFGVTSFSSVAQGRDCDQALVIARVAGLPEVVAGMRLEAFDPRAPMPVERALRTIDAAAADSLAAKCAAGAAEACAWWCAPAFAKAGLPAALMRAGIAAAPLLGLSSIFTFPHQRTRSTCASFGFRPVESLGARGGEFQYPTAAYVSTVMHLDAVTLATTPEEARLEIEGLRSGALDVLVEASARGTAVVRYLRIPRSGADASLRAAPRELCLSRAL